MAIDLQTLMIAGSFVAAVSGTFLIFAWLQTPGAGGMLWWGTANLLLSAAIPLVAFSDITLGLPSYVVGMTLLNASPGFIWAAARASNGRKVNFAVVGAGASVWLIAFAMPIVRSAPDAQMTLNLVVVAFYLLASAGEFWKGRRDGVTARWPLIVLLFLHGLFAVGGSIHSALAGAESATPAALVGWLAFVHFETLVFVVGTSIFAVAMARERNEMQQRIAARTDDLTGVATRRAFYDEAQPMLIHALQTDSALAAIIFDLDQFKSINDTFGHGPGDEVLRIFGEATTKTLRSSDLVGRLGGEEFGVILPGATVGAAFVAAERIRARFAEICSERLNTGIRPTVSAGIAHAHHNSSLDSVLKAADDALYRAKVRGRDRVEIEVRAGDDEEERKTEPRAQESAQMVRRVA